MKHSHTAKIVLGFVVLLSPGLSARARGEAPPSTLSSVDQLPAIRQLPDPFRKVDGGRVKGPQDWSEHRDQLKRLVEHYAYGALPPAPGNVKAEELDSSHNDSLGATEKKLLLTMGPGGKVRANLALTIPDGQGPFPAIIAGDLCWGKVAPAILSEVVKRGYVLAEFDRTEFAPDKADRSAGLFPSYPDADCGAIAGWAWGFHRMVDYLQTLPSVDGRRIAVTGHSRGGKAALLAGALDERIALTAPNNSGCFGAGCERFSFKGEDLDRIVQRFPFWFGPRLSQFAGRVERLPFDQHTVKALVAPRALLTTEGLGDTWANPPGTQITHQAAKVVYDFLGAGDKIGVVYRPGGHAHSLQDWQTLLDFADRQLLGKEVSRRFDELPFPQETEDYFTWTAPSGQ